ncbi:MAG: O-antigen ligase family protein, partial [Actinobacteria bacterium]|nr:O-antigen ligase family protein [Actinomycetota bacterium]
PQLVSTLESRLTSSPSTDSSVDWRDRAYEVALRGVDEQPVLGVGFGRESRFYVDGQPNVIEGDPHNGFLYLLAGGGVLALGGFLIVVAFYLQDAWRRLLSARDRTERSLVVWAVTTWFVFLLHAVVEPVLTYPSMIMTIWILMLLPALVPLRKRPGRAQGLPASRPR